jgi:hypothetical protein
MGLFSLLVALAVSFFAAVCDFWDSVHMANIAASDVMSATYDSRGNDLLCAQRGSDRAARIQLHDTRTPPCGRSMWNSARWSVELNRWYWSVDTVDTP